MMVERAGCFDAVISGLALLTVFTATPVPATTKGLSQIVTPDLQEEGDLSLSL